MQVVVNLERLRMTFLGVYLNCLRIQSMREFKRSVEVEELLIELFQGVVDHSPYKECLLTLMGISFISNFMVGLPLLGHYLIAMIKLGLRQYSTRRFNLLRIMEPRRLVKQMLLGKH